MTHIAAISLYIDGYRTDTCDLREDLQMEDKQYVTQTYEFTDPD